MRKVALLASIISFAGTSLAIALPVSAAGPDFSDGANSGVTLISKKSKKSKKASKSGSGMNMQNMPSSHKM